MYCLVHCCTHGGSLLRCGKEYTLILLKKYGNYFLGLIDSHSKWAEVAHMRSATIQNSIDQMRLWFVAYGLPKEVVSDNGPNSFHRNSCISLNRIELNTHWYLHIIHCWMGQQSTSFRSWSKHKRSMLRVWREVMKSVHWNINYRIVCSSTETLLTQYYRIDTSELFLKCKRCSKFSGLLANMEDHIQNQQGWQLQQHDRVKMQELFPCDFVNLRDTQGGVEKWVTGTVIRWLGPLTYLHVVRVDSQLHVCFMYVHIYHLLHKDTMNTEDEDDSRQRHLICWY